MYFDRFRGRIILDFFDVFLISMWIAIQATNFIKYYSSEESKNLRLVKDLTRQSNLANYSRKKKPNLVKYSSNSLKVPSINPLFSRGGEIKSHIPLRIAEKIQNFTIYFMLYLKEIQFFNKKRIMKLISSGGQIYLKLVLSTWNIEYLNGYFIYSTETR